MNTELEHYGVKGMKWGERKEEKPTKSVQGSMVRKRTAPIRKTSVVAKKSSDSRQKTVQSNRVRMSTAEIRKSSEISTKSETDRSKNAPTTTPNAVHYPDNLKGRSLLDTQIKDTPKWLEDNGYTMPVDDALDAVKKILPKRRSSGTDVVNALKNVNSQGGVSLNKMKKSTVRKGDKAVSRIVKKSK